MTPVTYVLIRIKSDITVRKAGDFLPGGSYLADIGGRDQEIRMRVIEYCMHVGGQHASETAWSPTCATGRPRRPCSPQPQLRWDGSQTALREAKSRVRGVGPSTGPIFRSRTRRT